MSFPLLALLECSLEMVGKSKDNKANKGKKALENEWSEALAAAEAGDPLIASSTNRPKGGKDNRPSVVGGGVYVAQAAGGSAKQRLKHFEEALAKAGGEGEISAAEGSLASMSLKAGGAGGGEEECLDEKELKKLKKRQEKEAAAAFERKAEEERVRRREEKERKEALEKEEALARIKELAAEGVL